MPVRGNQVLKTVSSREFNSDVAGAKRAASSEPVFITDRGLPAYVLLSVSQYRQITGTRRSALDAIKDMAVLCQAQTGELDFDWQPPKLMDGFPKPAEFSD